ncbi:MAG TPA: VWA domain-containing protein, partial [Lachnospiraceae bacterium]|nr:VWA domain-containing protein [Lachnospiraceae bacterium]
MKKRVEKYLVFVLAAVMLACMFTFPVLAADSANQVTTTSRNNVVFVTDSSGSMQTTDPDNNRFEAAKLFVAEIANDGNYLGSVSFGEGITDAQEVKNLSGQNEKNAFVDHIKNSSNYENSTNIGAGLSKAVDLLDNGRNKDLNSSIILLSDGNTDMPDKDKTQASLDMKADAIERARNAGYRIFTICLNADGSADTSELKQIADATNGAFTEVKDAADLKDVETMYNEKIFGSIEDSDGGSITIGPDGTVSKTFKVPGIGVEELNVLIEGTVTKCELTDPQNKIYSGNEIESSTVRGTDFLIEKIISPAGGTWTAKAYGNPNAVINFRPLYNLNFSIVTAISPESDYKVGQTVHFTASIADNTGTITDTSRYTDFNGEVHVKSAA